jgi:hypothetical protein
MPTKADVTMATTAFKVQTSHTRPAKKRNNAQINWTGRYSAIVATLHLPKESNVSCLRATCSLGEALVVEQVTSSYSPSHCFTRTAPRTVLRLRTRLENHKPLIQIEEVEAALEDVVAIVAVISGSRRSRS